MKLFNSVHLVSLATAGVLLAGCQDADYDMSKNYVSAEGKAFYEAFEARYGYIDPSHTFNDAFYGSVEVTTDAKALVTISAFIESTSNATVLLQAVVDGTETLTYDYPNGVNRVYVIAKAGETVDGTVLTPGERGKAVFNLAETKTSFNGVPPVQTTAKLIHSVQGMYTIDENGNKVQSYYNGDQILFPINEWTGNFYLTSSTGSYDDRAGDYTTSGISTAILSDLAAYCHANENKFTFSTAAQNITFQMTADGPVSLTLASSTTNSANSIGYFFTTPEHNTLADFKAADKYILIPWVSNDQGRKYYLTYYDENHTNGTRIIPEGTMVHFFLIRSASNQGIASTDALQGDMMWSSDPEISKLTADFYNAAWNYAFGSSLATTASFTYAGYKTLCFEDWPNTSSDDWDWNDVVFAMEGHISNGETEISTYTNAYTFACEDLGVSDDEDYNDLVFTVSQTHTVSKEDNGDPVVNYEAPVLSFKAAGGTLRMGLRYGDEVITNDVHQDFWGVEAKKMINTNNGTLTKQATKTYTLQTFGNEAFSAAQHAENFKILVNNQTITPNSTVSSKQSGSAQPYVLVIPGDTWQWPNERSYIDSLYANFHAWVNDQKAGFMWYNSDWYATALDLKDISSLVSSSTMTIENESGYEESPIIETQYGSNSVDLVLGSTSTISNPILLNSNDAYTYQVLFKNALEESSVESLDITINWPTATYVNLNNTSGNYVAAPTNSSDNLTSTYKVSYSAIKAGFRISSGTAPTSISIKVNKLGYVTNLGALTVGTHTFTPDGIYKFHQDGYRMYAFSYTLPENTTISIKTTFENDWNSGGAIYDNVGNYVSEEMKANNEWNDLSPANYSFLSTGFSVLHWNTSATLTSIEITVKEIAQPSEPGEQPGGVYSLQMGSNTLKSELNLYELWSGYYGYAYMYNVILPEAATKVTIKSVWNRADNWSVGLYPPTFGQLTQESGSWNDTNDGYKENTMEISDASKLSTIRNNQSFVLTQFKDYNNLYLVKDIEVIVE